VPWLRQLLEELLETLLWFRALTSQTLLVPEDALTAKDNKIVREEQPSAKNANLKLENLNDNAVNALPLKRRSA
jgi:hypothetical protein